MASATPATSSTIETTNYARLCRVLVDVGTCALRDTFDAICTPPTLHTVLATNQPLLQSLRPRRIINATQWGKLFPAIPTSVSSANFDITLLMVLLRNICGLTPPTTGWDALPAATDMSREADIARVKYFRNTVYAHAEQASVDDATFHKYWKEIRDTLVRLGGVDYKVAIDNLEVVCMDPAAEDHYKNLLIQWKSDEDNIKDVLKEFGKKLDDLVASAVTSVTKKTSDEGKSFKLEEMLDTSLVCREKNHGNELLKSFCKQCKVCICDKCGQTRHNNHTKVDIDQAAEQHAVDIKEIVKEMKNGIADYKEHVKKTKEFSSKSREKIATARNKVMTSLEELMRLLKEHESATLTRLELLEEKEQRELAVQLQRLQFTIEKLQTSVECCEAILQRNQSVEILEAHYALIERSRGLLNSEKLNIYKPSHVRYEINNKVIENVKCAFPAVGRVVVSSTDPLQSVVEGSGLQEPDVGSEATIKLTTKDSHENKCYEKDDQIHVKVQTPSGGELNHLLAPSEDGDHLITFTPDCVGQHDVLIAVNGQPLTGSPWRVHVAPHRYKSAFSFGSLGREQRRVSPSSIAINDMTLNTAVAKCLENRVQLFSPDGAYLKDIGSNKLLGPTSVAFTRSGEVFVVASGKMFCFNDSGDVLRSVTSKHLKQPCCLTIARDGRMVVCDDGDYTVKVLSSDGAQLLHTISAVSAPDRAKPSYAVCHQNMFFVSYSFANDVKVYNNDGVFLYSIGTLGSGDGQLRRPIGLTIDMFGNLVVCDSSNSRLQVFTLDGKFVSKIEGQHIGFTCPFSVAVSSTGQLFVTDSYKACVHVFK